MDRWVWAYHPSMNPFGYDPRQPAPAILRIVGLAIAVYGWLSDNQPAFIAGLVLGFAGLALTWARPRRTNPAKDQFNRAQRLTNEEFERQLADYEAGRRDTLPGQ